MHQPTSLTRLELSSYLITAGLLLLVLWGHLVPALLTGLLVYQTVHALAPKIRWQPLQGHRGRILVVAMLVTVVTGVIVGAITGAVLFFSTGDENLTLLLAKMAEILESSRAALPAVLAQHLPVTIDDLRVQAVALLREHASDLQMLGKEAGLMAAHVLVGIIIGAMLALHDAEPDQPAKPLSQLLEQRSKRFADAFGNVVFAQIKIASINAIATGVYLALILPMFGVELPLVKTMIALTFVFGLLPVVGNLMSNAVIVVVSLSHSVYIAGISLLFLVVIHKVEYFLNAKIIGSQISARPWEILMAMLVMEVLFGLAGVIAAPICYAYLKDELKSRGLV